MYNRGDNYVYKPLEYDGLDVLFKFLWELVKGIVTIFAFINALLFPFIVIYGYWEFYSWVVNYYYN